MTLERGRPRDESMKGGSQPTDMSLIHRRCNARVASPDRSHPTPKPCVNAIDYSDHMSVLSRK